MKSQLTSMLQVWKAVLEDASSACAIPVAKFSRDISRAERGCAHRGLGFLTLDLPTLDENLLQLLEEGSVAFGGPLGARKSSRDLRPRFLWDLWSLVCDQAGCLLPNASPDAIFMIRQLSCLYKKLIVECSPARIEKVVKEYYSVDHQIPSPSLRWDEDTIDSPTNCRFVDRSDEAHLPLFQRDISGQKGLDPAFAQRLDRVAGILASELGHFDSMSDDSLEQGFFRHGPGATSNLRKSSYKYDFPSWSDKLEGVFPFDWCASGVLGDVPPSRHEHPSALLAVPKTAKGPRLIASEPVEHQWCQQKVASWLEYRISRTLAGRFINLRDQGLSQDLVTHASIDRSLSTIDLSSASDRVACWHVERLFAANKPLLEAIHACRTRWIEDRTTSRDAFALRKFASMGSALTFPVQCIFFLAVALASAGCSRRDDIVGMVGKVRVFGDDIIIPTTAYAHLCDDLTTLGLKVNRAKSFSAGYFRESCGQDSWRGFDVTPVKPKSLDADTPTTLTALVDTCNNLYLKGLWRASEAVKRIIPRRFTENVFLSNEKDARGRVVVRVPGLVSLSSFVYARKKYDHALQLHYVPQPVALSVTERIAQDSSTMLREFFTRPYSAEQPRRLGVVRSRAAKYATLRVPVTTG